MKKKYLFFYTTILFQTLQADFSENKLVEPSKQVAQETEKTTDLIQQQLKEKESSDKKTDDSNALDNNEGIKDEEHKSNIDIFDKKNINKQDNHGNTYLHHAVQNKDIDLVKKLIKNKINIHLKNSEELTALYSAIMTCQFKIAEKLINIGALLSEKEYFKMREAVKELEYGNKILIFFDYNHPAINAEFFYEMEQKAKKYQDKQL
ncbi:ankyrin repeat domain-containing protein [Candidatus Babeliales bacterium]|nr:ankyrin repeat domain-containing protein [Candidatus Babeliales bacterium]